MKAAYVIDRLAGYTDGRPSWARFGRARTKAEALADVETFRVMYPGRKFRVRKARPKQ